MRRNLLTIIGIFLAILVLMLIGDVITIGEKLARVTHLWYVEYVFYGILLVSFLFFVVWPVVRLYTMPQVPALRSDGLDDVAALRRFGRELSRHCDYIPDPQQRAAHQVELRQGIDRWHDVPNLHALVDQEVRLRLEGSDALGVAGIDRQIKEWAKCVFMATAVSPNSKIDAFSSMVLNFAMIKSMVYATGYRPNNVQMWRLFFHILATALLAYTVSEALSGTGDLRPFAGMADSAAANAADAATADAAADADVADAVPDTDGVEHAAEGFSLSGILSRFRIPGFIVGSVLDGTTNALLTLRIGYVTRAYLTEGIDALRDSERRRAVKRGAIAAAVKALPGIVSDGSTRIGRGIGNAFSQYFRSDDWKRYSSAYV